MSNNIASSRPRQSELDTMTIVELLDKLVHDSSWAKLYRDQIARMCSRNHMTLDQLLYEHYCGSSIVRSRQNESNEQRPKLDLMFITRPENRIEFCEEICEMLINDWNFIDPKKAEEGGMRMHPEEARDFMSSLVYRDESIEDLTSAAKNTYWMIIDAFRRSRY